MRIWDIHPGYLNRQSLLGEHRELHALVSIMVNRKKGYSGHPETLRWVGCGWALTMRHKLLAAEMAFRGYREQSPVPEAAGRGIWPEKYLDAPGEQFRLLAAKYRDKEQGRIPLPRNGQQLWSQHKYSVMARNISLYKKIGKQVAGTAGTEYTALAALLTETLRTAPSAGGIRNALQHMQGHVSEYIPNSEQKSKAGTLGEVLHRVQQGALAKQEPYLLASTALSELEVWIPVPEQQAGTEETVQEADSCQEHHCSRSA